MSTTNTTNAQSTTRQAAIEDAVAKVRRNLEQRGLAFPHIASEKRYDWGANEDWIEGFHTGLAWLCYEYTGDDFFREQANRHIEDFDRRLTERVCLDHHDIGFLYGPSAFAGWVIEGSEAHRALALRAADLLMERWRAPGYIQAWGPEGDPKNGGRIIIDCLMNLPLLYWASETTGNAAYGEVAVRQAELSRRYLVRGDDSSYHTFYFDQTTGVPIGGGTHQGYHDGSTWTRGQAWGIYGFALSYRYTGRGELLATAKRMADYFLAHLPEDGVAYWDFNAPVTATTNRDSSASAIALCGLLEIIAHLPEEDADRQRYGEAAARAVDALIRGYATIGEEAEGLLDHGSYHVRGDLGPDGYMIWGDYYYLEALLRLERGVPGYWYER
ncbi:glycoside hydrolase family 88 protein [Paenibacillus methanolicus]|uniref:Unsaturated chondroitin disaccharide hydrolase n=1 Tax=Paenibacillus methanolicus TaxID=582686 RepID=A0A5S5C164_9BACL|nr:glycoside hydrolase family 88 protein [Paenibacillus methanolicus]TYP73175.1 unsaturated chondroitin disaccharide hydrolase [Paenibacillus methanolicus]